MKLGILITNGGTHSPEKWATAAAERIVNIAQTVEGERLLAAQKLQLAVIEALIPHHDDHQKEIIADLNTGTHFDKPVIHDPGDRLNTALADVQKAAVGTPWENHFTSDEIVQNLRFLIGQSLVDVAHVERLHWHDSNPTANGALYKSNPDALLAGPPEPEKPAVVEYTESK